MQVFGQGMVGGLDAFLHPHYTVSVSPMEIGEDGAVMAIFLSIIVFGWAIWLFGKYWRTNEEDELEEEGGPP